MPRERRDYRKSKSKYTGGRRSCDYPKTRGYVEAASDNSDGSYNRSEERRETWLCRGKRERACES